MTRHSKQNKSQWIGIFGFGNMMECLISQALLKKAVTSKSLISKCHRAKRDKILQKKYKIPFTGDLPFLSEKADVIFLGVKPQQISEVLHDIQPYYQNQIIWTIAAGVPIKTYQSILGKKSRIIRIMPNLPCALGAGTVAMYASQNVATKDKNQCEKFLKATGKVFHLKTEKQMHAVTALTGSGPAFLFEYIRNWEQSAKALGFTQNLSESLVRQTLIGAVQMWMESDISLEDLIAKVTSQKGTTEAGLNSLKKDHFETVILQCFDAAKKRSMELEKEIK